MKIIKYLFFLLLIFLIGASVYIATKDGSYQIEQKQMMAAPQEVVYDYVNDFTNWKDWEPWSQGADDVIVNYLEKTSGEGAGYSWKSEELGEGEIITLEANPHSDLKQKITFITPFGSSSSSIYWEFEKVKDSTLVTWGMQGKQSFMEKAAFIFQKESLSEMMLPMYRKGLDSLEEELRKKMESYTINVDGITQHGGGYYMYITTASNIQQISSKKEKMFSEVSTFMSTNNIEKVGKPFVLYNDWNESRGTAIYSAAFFTPSEVITTNESAVLNGFMPNQKTLKTTLNGKYENLKEAWDKAYNYIEQNGLAINQDAESFEVYVVGPNDNANPAEWITQIYIPLKTENEQVND
ncbi:SRPBCC family protein [Christiangramia aquimixticola]|uniref:SRPBCC family protein n=1 Tax=Christiangramia aquimixticola TaxID=1697558 RepID=UPI003AA8090F